MVEANTQAVPRPAPLPRLDLAVLRRNSEASINLSPVQSSSGHSRINTPSTSIPSTPVIPARNHSPERKPAQNGDTTSFLTALAAQERRVLELREELQKAESDLEKLKKHWAAQEALKKRNDSRHPEQLRPLTAMHTDMSPIGEESPNQIRREIERRKTLAGSTRSSQRKVFSGSRHTRTLSLLTNKNLKGDQVAASDDIRSQKSSASNGAFSSQSSTAETSIASHSARLTKESLRSPDKDMIIETGKQLVGDFRQGFWTFVEDLKQVTVGDESFVAQQSRPSPDPKNDARRFVHERVQSTSDTVKEQSKDTDAVQSKTHMDLALSDEQKKGRCVSSQSASIATISTAEQNGFSDSENEAWDDWGTPNTSASEGSRSTRKKLEKLTASDRVDDAQVNASPSNRARHLKTQAQSRNLDGEILWPTLSRFNPGKLTKTASNLMNEWEKNLTSVSVEPNNCIAAQQKVGKTD